MFFAKVSRQAIQRRMPKRLLGASHGQAWAKSKSLGKKRLSGKAKQNEGGRKMSKEQSEEQRLYNEQRMRDEIEYLSEMTGAMTRKLQAYEYVFNLMDEIRLKPVETVTCKYRLHHGSGRKRNKGVKCPPNCQVIIGHANTQWGKGCQIAHLMKEKREQTNE